MEKATSLKNLTDLRDSIRRGKATRIHHYEEIIEKEKIAEEAEKQALLESDSILKPEE
jgi:hypothetical protein